MAKFIDQRPGAMRLFWGFSGWFGLIFLVVGAGVMIGAGYVGLQAWRLAQEGEVVTGEVLGKDWRESRDSDGDTTTTYYVRFHFDTRTGDRIEDENSVSYDIYRDADNGDPVEVRYWPQDPMLNEIEPGSNRFMALMMGILGLPFFLVGLGFATVQARFALGAVRIREHGERLAAEVTEHQSTGLTVNNTRYYRLEWRDENGNIGKSRPAHPNRLKDYPPGSTISVFVDPRAATKGVWEGDVGQPGSGYGKAPRPMQSPQSPPNDRPPTVRRN